MKFGRSWSGVSRAGALALLLLLFHLPVAFAPSADARSPANSPAPTLPPHQVTEYALSTATAYPLGITTDRAGNVWFAEDNVDAIVEQFPTNSSVRAFHIPTNQHLAWIWFMVFDGAGNLWFADASQSLVWRFDPSTSSFANFTAGGAYPMALSYDSARGRLWFTSLRTEQVGYFRLDGGSASLGGIVNITAPAPGSGVSGIAVDSAGDVYVAESFKGSVVELSGTTLGILRTWNLPAGSEPVGLGLDSQRSRLWFTDHASSFFGYVSLNSSSVVEFPTSLLFDNVTYSITLPYWLDVSATGQVWFNEHIGNRIARFDPLTAQLTEFDVPTSNSSPLRLALDDNRGIVWFTEFAGNAIGRILENSSEDFSVLLSASSASLAPSVVVQATPSPVSQQGPEVSMTWAATGAPEPGFGVKVHQTGGAFQLQISDGEARPGNYSAAVCFEYSETNQCGYLLMTVPAPPSSEVLVLGIYAAVGAGVVLVLLALWRENRSEKKRLRPDLERLASVHPMAPKRAAATATTGRNRANG